MSPEPLADSPEGAAGPAARMREPPAVEPAQPIVPSTA